MKIGRKNRILIFNLMGTPYGETRYCATRFEAVGGLLLSFFATVSESDSIFNPRGYLNARLFAVQGSRFRVMV